MIKLLFDRELGKTTLKHDYNVHCEKLVFYKDFDKETLIPLPDIRCTFSLCISNDGNYLAAMHGNHSVSVIDVRINKLTHTLVGHPRSVWSGSFNPVDSTMLVTGCLGGHLIIWKLTYGRDPSYEQRHSFQVAVPTAISSIVFHNSGKLFLFSCDCIIYMWRVTEAQPTVCSHFLTKIKYLHILPYLCYVIVGFELPFRIDYTETIRKLRSTLQEVREEMLDFLRMLSITPNWECFMQDLDLLRPVEESRPFVNSRDLSKLKHPAAYIIRCVELFMYDVIDTLPPILEMFIAEYQFGSDVIYNENEPSISLLIGIASRQYENLRIEEDHTVLLNYIADVLRKVNTTLTLDPEPQIDHRDWLFFASLFNDAIAHDFLRVHDILSDFPSDDDDYVRDAQYILIFYILKALVPVMLSYVEIYWRAALNHTYPAMRAELLRTLVQTQPPISCLKLAQIKAFDFEPLNEVYMSTNVQFFSQQDTVVPTCIINNTASVAASEFNGLSFVAAILYHRAIGVYSLNDSQFGLLIYTFQVDYTSTIALALTPLHNHIVVACRRRKTDEGNSIFIFKIGLDHFVAHNVTNFKSKINCMVFLKNLKDGIAIGLDGGDGIFRRNRTLN